MQNVILINFRGGVKFTDLEEEEGKSLIALKRCLLAEIFMWLFDSLDFQVFQSQPNICAMPFGAKKLGILAFVCVFVCTWLSHLRGTQRGHRTALRHCFLFAMLISSTSLIKFQSWLCVAKHWKEDREDQWPRLNFISPPRAPCFMEMGEGAKEGSGFVRSTSCDSHLCWSMVKIAVEMQTGFSFNVEFCGNHRLPNPWSFLQGFRYWRCTMVFPAERLPTKSHTLKVTHKTGGKFDIFLFVMGIWFQIVGFRNPRWTVFCSVSNTLCPCK